MVRIVLLLCTLAASDREWIDTAIEAWRVTARDALRLPSAPLPEIVFFDEACTWPAGGTHGTPHRGDVRLPDGQHIPARVTSFASAHEGRPFLVMALPSVWRKEPRHAENARLERMTRSVFVHEMTHTAQTATLGARIGDIIERHQLPSNEVDDDIVQKKFGGDPEHRKLFEAERDLFYAAARAVGASERRALLTGALSKMRERRRLFLSGDNRRYAELEDVFLMMEGSANWAAMRDAMRERTRDEAIETIRGGRRWWTQDEGLAIFLAIDATGLDWQSLVFGSNPPTLEELIERAARE